MEGAIWILALFQFQPCLRVKSQKLVVIIFIQMLQIIIWWLVLVLAASAQVCELPIRFDCNRTDPYCPGASSIYSLPQTIYNCDQELNLSADTLKLSGDFSGLTLNGVTISLNNLTTERNLSITVLDNLSLSGLISIGELLLVGTNITTNFSFDPQINNDDIYSAITAVSHANITANKFIIIGMNSINIYQSSISTTFRLCLYTKIDVNTMSKNMTKMMESMDLEGIGEMEYAVFLYASSSLNLEESYVSAVSILTVSLADITINSSNLNASARSCRTNTGIGRGTTIQYQNTYCTSGGSSCGYGSISNNSLCSDIVEYFMFLSHSLPYISKGPYLSTGSGGYGYVRDNIQSGAGGGIIFMLAEATSVIETSNIEASGGSVGLNDTLSAGSGGTIFISSQTMLGLGASNILAAGGNSSNNNGSGGGGLVKISYQNFPTKNQQNFLWVNINQGIQTNDNVVDTYSNGIFYGANCLLGQMSNYLSCENCPIGYYSSLGDPICRACPTISDAVLSSTKGNQFIYQCYQVQEDTPWAWWLTPGDISLLSILLYLVFLIIFTVVGAILKKRIKKQKMASGDDFKIEEVERDIQKAKILALQLRQSKQIKSYELMYHVHRISCFGCNTEESPWVLPLSVPDQMRKYVHAQVFTNFAESFNEAARWTKCQYWLTKLSVLVYPLYWYYMDRVKHRKYFTLLTKFQHAKDYNLLNNYEYEDRSILTIKFSKTKDYTNCYLDFFVYQRADIRYFTLSSPFLIYFSGEGNFLRPFYLQEDDIFYRMMFFVVSRNLGSMPEGGDERSRLFSNMVSHKKRQQNSQEIVRFLRKLNTLACTLDLSAPHSVIISVLWNLLEFIDRWNKEFFNRVTVHLDLLIMISKLSKGSIIDNDVQIPTTRDRNIFSENMTRKLQEISHWQHTMKIALCVYNPEQEIPREEESQIRVASELVPEEFSQIEPMESIRESLMNVNTMDEPAMRSQDRSRLGPLLGRLRYYMFSHQRNIYDEYTIKFLQSLFILMQTMLVFIWSVKLQLPYILINLINPMVGVIWFVSDSYGFGKLYLILLAMNLLNQITTLIIFSIIESTFKDRQLVVRNVVSCIINILIILLMMFVGKRAITLSKKLSLKKEDQHKKE